MGKPFCYYQPEKSKLLFTFMDPDDEPWADEIDGSIDDGFDGPQVMIKLKLKTIEYKISEEIESDRDFLDKFIRWTVDEKKYNINFNLWQFTDLFTELGHLDSTKRLLSQVPVPAGVDQGKWDKLYPLVATYVRNCVLRYYNAEDENNLEMMLEIKAEVFYVDPQ